jgi:hypothetical protein
MTDFENSPAVLPNGQQNLKVMDMANKLSPAFINAVVHIVDRWWAIAGELTTSAGARAYMQANLRQNLYAGDRASVPLDFIIRMAESGHEPAQWALRDYIGEFIQIDRFNDLPVSRVVPATRLLYSRRLGVAIKLSTPGRAILSSSSW